MFVRFPFGPPHPTNHPPQPLVSPSPPFFLYFVRITLSFRPQITHQYVLVCIHLSSCVASSHVTTVAAEPDVIIDLPAAVARKSWQLKRAKERAKGRPEVIRALCAGELIRTSQNRFSFYRSLLRTSLSVGCTRYLLPLLEEEYSFCCL